MRSFYLFIITAILLIFTGMSCKQEESKQPKVNKCDTIACLNGGVCNESSASCACPSGYEGRYCQTVSRYKFLGNWTVFEDGSRTLPAQYAVSIQSTAQIDEVVIQDFNNYFVQMVKATISDTTITIPEQFLEGKLVHGVGTIHNSITYGQWGSMELRYQVIDTATNLVNNYGFYTQDGTEPSHWNK